MILTVLVTYLKVYHVINMKGKYRKINSPE